MAGPKRPPRLLFSGEAFRFGVRALRANKIRTVLTALGLVIGNASVILVVTISLKGRDYILDQIRGVGSNLIYAQFEGGSNTAVNVDADYLKIADVEAVRRQLGDRITAATGVVTSFDRMFLDGKERDVAMIGSDDQYPLVRNLRLLSGRFLDPGDVSLRQKVAMLTEKLAARLFGGQSAAVGRTVKLHGLRFTVIGTFKERTSTFGQAELRDETVLIPITVIRYFTTLERVDPLYVQARDSNDVEPLVGAVRQILESRHRPGARYAVETLTAILDAARKISWILSIVLFLVSALALGISGIGIMNIMLVTVTERTREIGLRKAIGASSRDVLEQFLVEAVLISVAGGAFGILIGISIPLAISFLTGIPAPVSWVSVLVAFAVSLAVGLAFGILPAKRAARLNPTEALRYE